MNALAYCIECGCHDQAACSNVKTGQPCSWLAVDRDAGVGVCSECRGAMKRWNTGDRTTATPTRGGREGCGYRTRVSKANGEPRCDTCRHVSPRITTFGTKHDRRCSFHQEPCKTHGHCSAHRPRAAT